MASAEQGRLLKMNTGEVVKVPSWRARDLVDSGQAQYAMNHISHRYPAAGEVPIKGWAINEVTGDDVRGVTEPPREAWSPRPPGHRT